MFRQAFLNACIASGADEDTGGGTGFVSYLFTGQHPGNFLMTLNIVKFTDRRGRHIVYRVLLNLEMIVSFGRDLRRMGNDQHLNILRQARQAFADGLCRRPRRQPRQKSWSKRPNSVPD